MLTEREAAGILAKGITFEPFRLTLEKRESAAGADSRADFILRIDWNADSQRFAAEYRSAPGLASLRAAIAQAKASAYSNPDCLPMVLKPFLRKEALDELISAETSGLDLCGNGVIYVPGKWFAYRTGAPNKYPDSAPVKSPFRGNQSIVARAFLARPTFENQKHLVSYLKESGIAASTVSKMLTALEQELLITKKPAIRLIRPEALLDHLRDDYSAPIIRRAEKVRLMDNEFAWTSMNSDLTAAQARYAISEPERYTVFPKNAPVCRVFTNNIDRLLSGVDYEFDDRFPTVELIETDSRVPFFDRRRMDGLWFTSPIQEYLALANGSKREMEAATAIRHAILGSLEVA